jgi:hypothetical protein
VSELEVELHRELQVGSSCWRALAGSKTSYGISSREQWRVSDQPERNHCYLGSLRNTPVLVELTNRKLVMYVLRIRYLR